MQSKVEQQLGENWARPKGMHHKTRERLLEVIFRCEELREDELARFLARHASTLWSG